MGTSCGSVYHMHDAPENTVQLPKQQRSTSFFEGILNNATECICAARYIAKDADELTLHIGDHLNIIKRSSDTKWYCESNQTHGFIPTQHIKLRWKHYIDIFTVDIRIAMQNNPQQYAKHIAIEAHDRIHMNKSEDNQYFDGYNLQTHHDMLVDAIRTNAYKNAIASLQDYIKDKVVLDVGCGTCILSIFAAKAGAKHVYAVDASQFVHKARNIVAENNLTQSITVLHGKIEEVVLPVNEVDVILSEWMGHMLITESMIHSVIVARDKYLDKCGLMMPSHCNMYFAAIDLRQTMETKVDYFDDVYGVKMETLKKDAEEMYLGHVMYNLDIDASHLLTEAQIMKHFDMYTVDDDELECFEWKFKFVMMRDGFFCGFASWFDVVFNPLNVNEFKGDIVTLDTSPLLTRTHWSQSQFPLSKTVEVKKGDVVEGELCYFRNNVARRNYRMYIKCNINGFVFRKMFDYVMTFDSDPYDV